MIIMLCIGEVYSLITSGNAIKSDMQLENYMTAITHLNYFNITV